MTGRRSIAGWDARLSRALQFVPGHVGGRVASAQPIRRRGGTLRRVSVGAVGRLAATEPTYVDYGYNNGDAGTAEIYWGIPRVTGDIMVATCVAPGTLCSPPAGWTELASGTLGDDAAWCTAWGVSAGGSGDYEGEFAVDASSYHARVSADLFRGGSMTPQLIGSVVTAASSTSGITFPGVGSSVLPIQYAVMHPDTTAVPVWYEIDPTPDVAARGYFSVGEYAGLVGTTGEDGPFGAPTTVTVVQWLTTTPVASAYAALTVGFVA